LKFRSSGVQEFRSSGVQEFRSSGVKTFFCTKNELNFSRSVATVMVE
jgi:hypothetical protein